MSVEVLCTLVFLFERVHIHHPPGFPFHLLPFGSHFHSQKGPLSRGILVGTLAFFVYRFATPLPAEPEPQMAAITKPFSAAVIGGSGQVGLELVKTLVASSQCVKITLLSRRALPDVAALDKKIDVKIVDMTPEAVEKEAGLLANHDIAFMALGIGRASKASKEELMKIDGLVPIAFAKAAKAANIQHMSVLSAVGADINATWSMITRTAPGCGWYNHVKGTCEEGIKALGFSSVAIFRPAAILGNANTPKWMDVVSPTLDKILPKKYASTSCAKLGLAMFNEGVQQLEGKVTGAVTFEGGAEINKLN